MLSGHLEIQLHLIVIMNIEKSIEEATENALKTFSQDSKHFPNDQVFITSAKSDYKNATFIDGNGNEHTYQEAQKIISQNIKF